MANDLIPISDEQAKLGTEALKVLQSAGAFFSKVLGTAPEDAFGLLIGDTIRVRRAENIARMVGMARERLEQRRVYDPEPVSLSLGVPLLQAAADESREELVDLWSRLLATAMDPARAGRVRRSFVEAVKKMDPLDARVLLALGAMSGDYQPSRRQALADKFGIGSDQIEVSFQNLYEVACLQDATSPRGQTPNSFSNPHLLPFGRELLAALSD